MTARLSRRALAVVPSAGGAVLTGLSRTHGLVVDADGAGPVRPRTHTKEFVTALMLCRHRLLDATDTAPPGR